MKIGVPVQPVPAINDNDNEAADEDNNKADYEEDENESENKEELLQSLSEVMDTVQQQLYANIDDSSVEKCTRFIVKHLQKASAIFQH